MMKIKLLEFIRTGALGPVRLGMTDRDVLFVLGAPDAQSDKSKDGAPYICKYGDMELYYEQEDERLVSIVMDECDVPDGGMRIDLDPWVIRGGLLIEEMEQALRAQGIRYVRRPHRALVPVTLLVATQSGVEIDFFDRPLGSTPAGLHYLTKSGASI